MRAPGSGTCVEKQIPRGNDRKKSKGQSDACSGLVRLLRVLSGTGFSAGGWGWVVGLAAGWLEDGGRGVGLGGQVDGAVGFYGVGHGVLQFFDAFAGYR